MSLSMNVPIPEGIAIPDSDFHPTYEYPLLHEVIVNYHAEGERVQFEGMIEQLVRTFEALFIHGGVFAGDGRPLVMNLDAKQSLYPGLRGILDRDKVLTMPKATSTEVKDITGIDLSGFAKEIKRKKVISNSSPWGRKTETYLASDEHQRRTYYFISPGILDRIIGVPDITYVRKDDSRRHIDFLLTDPLVNITYFVDSAVSNLIEILSRIHKVRSLDSHSQRELARLMFCERAYVNNSDERVLTVARRLANLEE